MRREVDIAKGTRVAVLPVKIRADFNLSDTLKKFDIAYVQSLSLLTGTKKEFRKLRKGIDQLYESNRGARQTFLASLDDTAAKVHEPADPDLYSIKFKETEICLAAGDFLKMGRRFDALINPENDYMQMARIFEAKTISSLLRYYGSRLDQARRIVEDSVQDELDEKVRKLTNPVRPVVQGTVLVTSAGHEQSYLRKKMEVRYILHAASVTVQGGGANKYLAPIRDSGALKEVVRNVLCHARHLGGNEPIKSIYLPMFGTGKGGVSVDDVVTPIVGGVKEYLLDEDKQPLKKIYLGVYFKEDVNILKTALKKEFVDAADDDASSV